MDKERNREMICLQKLLIAEFEAFRKKVAYGGLDQVVFALPEKKLSDIGVRGYFVRKMYDYIKTQASIEGTVVRSDLPPKWFEVSLPLLAELIISLQYYHNQILDRKSDVKAHAAICNNLIAANLLRSVINQYVEEIFGIDKSSREKVRIAVEMILAHVDTGQYMDKNWGTYECWVNGLPENTLLSDEINEFISEEIIEDIWTQISEQIPVGHEQFTKLYLKRIYLCNGSLFILFSRLLSSLLEYKGDVMALERFSTYLAMPLQMMNDNIDFSPPQTVAKFENDVYSDLKNKTMSFPLILFFNKFPTEKPKSLLSQLTSGLNENILALIFEVSKPITTKIAKKSEKHLDTNNVNYQFLLNLSSPISSNRYYIRMEKYRSSLSNRCNHGCEKPP